MGNLFKTTGVVNTIAAIDNIIQNKYYPGLSSDADGIDLKIELNRILFGSDYKHPLGHWVVVRTFDDTERSKYFNNYSKEGIMGPPKVYTDYLLLSRRVPVRFQRTTTDTEKVANIVNDAFVYYFEHPVNIKAGSQIYEIDKPESIYRPENYKYTDKFEVVKIQDFRLENGRTQYHAAVCENTPITL